MAEAVVYLSPGGVGPGYGDHCRDQQDKGASGLGVEKAFQQVFHIFHKLLNRVVSTGRPLVHFDKKIGTNQKKRQQTEDTPAAVTSELTSYAQQKRSENGSEFAKNIVDAKKMRAFLFGDELAVATPTEGLDAAHGRGHQKGNEPERSGS